MEPLTQRQIRVAQLIADGCSNIEIAERLGIMERTVRSHCDTIKVKLGVTRKREIAGAMRRAGLL